LIKPALFRICIDAGGGRVRSLIEVGVMELNRYPDNFFAELEQVAISPDKMLQGRLFSYGDTQRYRLGINFNHIPVNRRNARSSVITLTARCEPTAISSPRRLIVRTAKARGWIGTKH
jgi:hypothetical protein